MMDMYLYGKVPVSARHTEYSFNNVSGKSIILNVYSFKILLGCFSSIFRNRLHRLSKILTAHDTTQVGT